MEDYDYTKLPMNPNPSLPNWMNGVSNENNMKKKLTVKELALYFGQKAKIYTGDGEVKETTITTKLLEVYEGILEVGSSIRIKPVLKTYRSGFSVESVEYSGRLLNEGYDIFSWIESGLAIEENESIN